METSNLLDYSANKLHLMLRGIKLVAKNEQACVLARRDMLNGEDLSEPFEVRQLQAIKIHKENLQDLKELKIAILTNLRIVSQREKSFKQ